MRRACRRAALRMWSRPDRAGAGNCGSSQTGKRDLPGQSREVEAGARGSSGQALSVITVDVRSFVLLVSGLADFITDESQRLAPY
ncbi:hypothetical protein Hsero_1289 [Herbaspirillum seropedicae SmR1]|uniref:Uncharacterized protein n=1 Tax=Herbaspirillum seropedicae (strain SmR1) TaxID=757424 RepID=D8INY5_HERSS|nr:hypothetical protein Hsero_1289 [Herbaspirillum seropedicae SmR1]AON53525.1 hypothetical protein Hsc_1222 [Herbaspirillum seropedicae]